MYPALVHEIVTGGYAGQLFANRPFGLVDEVINFL